MALELIRRKTDYGLRALSYLAQSGCGTAVMAAEIAEAEGVPRAFLHKILEQLVDHKVLRARRGPAGGFLLARPPEKISVLEVADILQGPVAVTRCVLSDRACSRQHECQLRAGWIALQEQLMSFLGGLSLADLGRERVASASRDTGAETAGSGAERG